MKKEKKPLASKFLEMLAKKKFLDVKLEGVKERVFEQQIRFPKPDQKPGTVTKIPVYIRIYSTLEMREFRDTGDDAVRVQAVRKFDGYQADQVLYPIGNDVTRVNRVGSSASFNERVLKYARECFKAGIKEYYGAANAPSKQKKDWREDPASEAQKKHYLKLTSVALPEGLTKGQASDLIGQSLQAKGITPDANPRKRRGYKAKTYDTNPSAAQWDYLKGLTGFDWLMSKYKGQIDRRLMSLMIEAAKNTQAATRSGRDWDKDQCRIAALKALKANNGGTVNAKTQQDSKKEAVFAF